MTMEVASVQQRAAGAGPPGPKPTLTGTVAELIELLDLRAASERLRPGQEIVSEGKPCRSVFLITEGLALRYRILRDGQRQIINFLVPGDFAGVVSSRLDNAPFSVRALTPTLISPIPVASLNLLFETQPRLARHLAGMFASEIAILGEHLISLGRRRAVARVAHLLLEFHLRLRRVGLADETGYRLPLTQAMLGDALGLSVPYLNQVLQELRTEGLATVKDQWVEIENWEALEALADFRQSYLRPPSGSA